jgi:hypothetical protein
MAATLEIVNKKLSNVTQEILDNVLAYVNAITEPSSTFYSLSEGQQAILDDQVNFNKKEYISKDQLNKELKKNMIYKIVFSEIAY